MLEILNELNRLSMLTETSLHRRHEMARSAYGLLVATNRAAGQLG